MKKLPWWMPVLLAVSCVTAYCNTFHVPFLFDDVASIRENPAIRGLWPPQRHFAPPYRGGITISGRPVLSLSFAINYILGGREVYGYHTVNLGIHILAALALFGVVRRTFRQPGMRERLGDASNGLALVAALLWAVHPLQTESVTYIIQRAESLMGLFYLLTLYFFIRGVESPRSHRWHCLCVIACALGMASKEVMVSAPLVVLLYDRTFLAGTFRNAWQRRQHFYLGLASTWIVLALLVWSTGFRGETVGFASNIQWRVYAWTQCWAFTRYLWLSIWPHPLVFDYGVLLVPFTVGLLGPLLVLAIALVGTAWALRSRPALGFLGAWFFLILAPTSSIIPVITQTVAEHRLYLPLAALITAVVAGIYSRLPSRCLRHGLATTAALVLITLTIQRNAQYRNAESIWADVIAKRPGNIRGHANLGAALLEQGQAMDSLPHFQTALRLDPNDPGARCNFAAALAAVGDDGGAMEQYQETLRRTPRYAPAHVALASLLADRGDRVTAQEHYRIALRLHPNDATAHFNLALLLLEAGQDEQAIAHFNAATRLNPRDVRSQVNLGNLQLQHGNWNSAIAVYTAALRIDPNSFEAHNNLAIALANQGDLLGAVEHFREAARLQPGQPDVRRALEEAQRHLNAP